MSDGRVTIACGVYWCTESAATHINFAWWQNREPLTRPGWPRCAVCAEKEDEGDARIRKTHEQRGPRGRWIAWTAALINPGTCSESDVLAVECAMDAIARLLRRDEADVARLRAAAEAVAGRYYERCGGVYHGYDREWNLRPSHWESDDMCLQCHGTGLVLRRRSDGTAVIDELDAGSVAA